ncbi:MULTISPECIES: long-chain-fatty-acid--CoA ligase [unclassified Streptomyces]|uniref:long-chain-fatty-acid--CoA ligase n=1 Tax=unclassified Streptomyces TaxID=2593676 RepID=UPI001903723F|nr:long-chain-fatty-acid--CoA ligase [Streptomyces sp. HSG2]
MESEGRPSTRAPGSQHTGPRTLVHTARLHARHAADVAAVICEGRTVTHAELHRRGNRLAHALRAEGIAEGDRVAYLAKESEYYYEALLACAKTGAVLVPVNWRLTAPEVGHILRDSGTRLLFLDDERAPLVEDAAAGFAATVVRVGDIPAWRDGHGEDDPGFEPGPDTPVAQLYTSGTTGLPKGVVLAHRSFFAIRDALASEGLDWIDWRPGDVALVGIPGFHVGGLWWATQNLAAGTTVVAMPSFTAAGAVDLVRDLGVTTACVVPAMLRMMLAEPGVTQADFVGLRKVVYGGSPISEALLEESLAVFDCEFAQIYGLTETGNTAVCLPPAAHVPGGRLMRAAGRPYPGVRVKVVDERGHRLPTGAVGEVCLHTPARMVEYWGLPDKTAETLVDGWIHTGDAGRLDEDGHVFILDRVKDTVIVAGENVYPAEIENVLETHPGVVEAVVVGAPDERWGEYAHAFVVPDPQRPPTARELHTFLVPRLASFKRPSRYDFVDAVPRNPSGKILRRELRDRFWTDTERKVN